MFVSPVSKIFIISPLDTFAQIRSLHSWQIGHLISTGWYRSSPTLQIEYILILSNHAHDLCFTKVFNSKNLFIESYLDGEYLFFFNYYIRTQYLSILKF